MWNKSKNKLLLILSVVSFLASTFVFVLFLNITSQIKTENELSNYISDQIIVAVNRQRRENDLPELIVSTRLNAAADNKAGHMSQYSYFSHVHNITG